MPDFGDVASPRQASQTATIYHQCRRAILNWEWRPGSLLVISELQKRFSSKEDVVRAIYHLEAEGYINQSSRARYRVAEFNEADIQNHYRSIDFGYGEALRSMIGFMEDGTISPLIVELIEEVLEAATVSKQMGYLHLDDIFTAKYYYICILTAARNFELMNYVLIVDKLRYSRWIAEAIDESSRDDLFRLNFQLQRNIAERSVSGATALMTYIFEEYRRLIKIYLSSRPDFDESDKLDYQLVGDHNPSGYEISPLIDSEHMAMFIGSVRDKMGSEWPHVFVDRMI